MSYQFKEVQKFTQWSLWLILLGIGALFIIAINTQIINNKNFCNQTASDEVLIILASFIFLLIILFSILKLKTKIDYQRIEMHFYPFIHKRINWSEVENVQIIEYGNIGGWGIRNWSEYGRVYNVKGRTGLVVQLKNGESFVIGTQNEKELNAFLDSYKKYHSGI